MEVKLNPTELIIVEVLNYMNSLEFQLELAKFNVKILQDMKDRPYEFIEGVVC